MALTTPRHTAVVELLLMLGRVVEQQLAEVHLEPFRTV